MGRDRVADLRGLAVPPRDVRPDQSVRSLHLMGEGLADVVQKSRAPRLLRVQPELARHDAADEGGLDRMRQDVLPVAVPILQHAEELHEQQSVSKSFTSALMGIAIAEGRIESVDRVVV